MREEGVCDHEFHRDFILLGQVFSRDEGGNDERLLQNKADEPFIATRILQICRPGCEDGAKLSAASNFWFKPPKTQPRSCWVAAAFGVH